MSSKVKVHRSLRDIISPQTRKVEAPSGTVVIRIAAVLAGNKVPSRKAASRGLPLLN